MADGKGNVAIRVEGLGKQYRLGATQERYHTFRDQLGKWAKAPFRALARNGRADPRPEFWALKDVSFDVQPGEVVGIIGRNGAGKSTLLKILSRVTEPTEGGADIYGRVGSLLEVGTGFHPELTGRENIYLNGAILGMRRAEITRKFDDIVAFAEIEKFIDTPVKRYSSGMYTRLAFAVAAYLDPEILIVDEILAVGDAQFQKKCLGKLGEVSKDGRTVLFVSHNMNAIRQLCSRAIVMLEGQVVADGEVATAMTKYLSLSSKSVTEWRDNRLGPSDPTGAVRFTRVSVSQPDGQSAQTFAASEGFCVVIEYHVLRHTVCQVAFRLNDDDGSALLTSADGDKDYVTFRSREPGRYRSFVYIPGHLVAPGRYHLLVAANRPSAASHDLLEQVLHFEVDAIGSLRQLDQRLGTTLPMLGWREENVGGADEEVTELLETLLPAEPIQGPADGPGVGGHCCRQPEHQVR